MNYKEQIFNAIPIPDKLVNEYIYGIQPIPHQQQQYDSLLALRAKIQANLDFYDQYQQTIDKKPIQTTVEQSNANICQCCYQEIFRSYRCGICGEQCCSKCLVRSRMLPSEEEPTEFCEKCDEQFLRALIAKEFWKEIRVRKKSLKTLAQEQQMINSLFAIQKQKISIKQEQTGKPNKILQLNNRIHQLKIKNQTLRADLSETHKKIQWGTEINYNLNKKYKKLARVNSQSFASSVPESEVRLAPPQVDMAEQISLGNLNELSVNTMLNESTQQVHPQSRKCECRIF